MIYDIKTNYRLLVVEDNPGDYALIEGYLSAVSFVGQLDHAKNFSEMNRMLNGVSKTDYHAVLLDLKLPDKEGEDLIRETIKLAHPAPVIALTGLSDMSFSVRSLSMGISDYIEKDKLDSYGLWRSIRYSIERNAMYKKLSASEKRYRELFENNPSPMLIWDPETGQILDSNTEAQLKYGYGEKEFQNLTVNDIQLNKFERPINGNGRNSFDYSHYPPKQIWRHKKKNGEIFLTEINGHLIEFKNKTATLMLLNDVTEKIDLQEKMIENVLQAEERERNRVARELHDGIVQQLAACGMFTQNLMDEINNPDSLKEKINKLYELMQQTTLQTRDLSHNLQSAEFDVMTISDLLRRLVQQLTSSSHIDFSLKDHLPDHIELPTKVKVNLYRIVQELCANITKHSGATNADIIIEHTGDQLILKIRDNGKYFDPETADSHGAGLINVNSRVFRLGGSINYQPLEIGMMVQIEIPLED
ncbi:PAS domain S-box protein [Rhodohalobacter sp. SW132]|uniref:PAS domain S-box protein n=1 Tax=Rhodohalobacter sp. SW132 TaxID=2293433 RepID=UPI000E2722BF|nr:PAS domain S-box protein [Rhodohalobacter sp. SW132]REL29129.1 PAS domain S-box protein [Rhodohalobacter sp. SW132]